MVGFDPQAVPISLQPVGQGSSGSGSLGFCLCMKGNLNLPLGKAMAKISGNSAREVVRAVKIVKIYWRPNTHHGTKKSCSRTLIVWKQSFEPRSPDRLVWKLERVKGGSTPLTSASH